jgi:hypothetical protein
MARKFLFLADLFVRISIIEIGAKTRPEIPAADADRVFCFRGD